MGTAADRSREIRRDLIAGDRGELAGDLVLSQAGEPDPAHGILPGKRRKKRGEFIPPAGLGVAVRGQQQQPRSTDSRGKMPQQPQRRRIRPVHVVEHEEQAGAGRRVHQELANRLEQLEPPLCGVS